MQVVVATAGHVDHGKSTLVQALTGSDPDRLAEEKARGLTIDLGFAWASRPTGCDLVFVDVPGHARFIGNMLAGAGSVDACLFVVAAPEGWRQQSEEHLRILQLLGYERGVIAVTKVGLVDVAQRELVRHEIAARVTGTFLARAEVVEVDAVAGCGIGDLGGALDRLIERAPPPADRDRPRLWIDRAFVAAGSGTVVTGTLVGGVLGVGDRLVVVPGVRPVRIRRLQALERDHDRMAPGSRVAVNLVGASRTEVPRGRALVRPGQWRPTRTVDATLEVLPGLGHDLTRRGAYAAHLGSGEHQVTIRLIGAAALPPGGRGHVRLHLPVDLPLLPGDRYVLREHGRAQTVGGGEILDVAPALPAARARPSRDVDQLILARGWIDVDDLDALTGERRSPTLGRWVVAPSALDAGSAELLAEVATAGPLGLDVGPLDEQQRALLATLSDVLVARGRAHIRDDGVPDVLTGHSYLVALEATPFAPPPPLGVDGTELQELVRRGLVVRCDGVCFAASALARAARVVADLVAAAPAGITVAQARSAWGTTRKFALPLLAQLDATGVTRRRGDLRVAGPRLPSGDGGGGRESNPPSQDHHDHPL